MTQPVLVSFADQHFTISNGERMPVAQKVRDDSEAYGSPVWSIIFGLVDVGVRPGDLWANVEKRMKAARLADEERLDEALALLDELE